jgi:hypothetical protein
VVRLPSRFISRARSFRTPVIQRLDAERRNALTLSAAPMCFSLVVYVFMRDIKKDSAMNRHT